MANRTCISLSPEAEAILKRKVKPRYRSSYLSTLVVSQQVREEVQAQYEARRRKEEWDETGCNVE
jgi:hypothetical protein